MTTAKYVPVKQGGRHLLGENEFEYRQSTERRKIKPTMYASTYQSIDKAWKGI